MAADQWLQVKPVQEPAKICLESQGQEFSYFLLDQAKAVEFKVNGPRRIKLISRYLAGPGDPERQAFALTVHLDGDELVRKTFHAENNKGVVICGNSNSGVSSLRRIYVDIPKGSHKVQVLGQSPGSGDVACRLFKQSKRKSSGTVPFAPEGYLELATLQFDSGNQSTYYRFEAGTPLQFTVNGPTNLQLYTRLDFDLGMLGSQKYTVEVWRDGELWRTFHYDVTRLSNAFYPDQLELLPGTRKKLRITVPDGSHSFEVRCVRPENCGISAQIRIPRKDLQGRP